MTGRRHIRLVFAAALSAVIVTLHPVAASAGSLAYLISADHQTLTVFDTATNTVVTTVSVTDANRVAISPDGTRAYITAGGATGQGSVLVFDTSNHSLVTTINVGTDPRGVVFSHDGTRAYVANYRSNSVSSIDTSNYQVSTVSNVGTYVPAVAVSPDGTLVYAANEDGKAVTVINTSNHTINRSIDLSSVPSGLTSGTITGLAVSPDGTRVYASSGSGHWVAFVDLETNTVPLYALPGGSPTMPVVNADGSRLYVPMSGGGVSVIDTESGAVITEIDVALPNLLGDHLIAALSDDGLYLYVSTPDGVVVIDVATNEVVDAVDVSSIGGGVAIQFSGYSEGGGGDGGGGGEEGGGGDGGGGGGSGGTSVPMLPLWALVSLGGLLKRASVVRALRAAAAIAVLYAAVVVFDAMSVLNLALASAAAGLMTVAGFAAAQTQTILTLNGASVVVTNDCNGLGAWLLIAGAMVALPGVAWHWRLVGMAASGAAITALNISRIATLCYLQAEHPAWFAPVHEQIAPLLIVMTACACVTAWMRGVEHARPR